MFHLIKLYQYFCGSYEQAKAFTEVFFIYKPTFRVISAININSVLSAQKEVKPFSEWRVTLIGK